MGCNNRVTFAIGFEDFVIVVSRKISSSLIEAHVVVALGHQGLSKGRLCEAGNFTAHVLCCWSDQSCCLGEICLFTLTP
ncbi:hypothetical protein AKJ16_DCAP03614 [Drosera capensis]